MRLDPAIIKQQVDGLLAEYPELAEDDVLRLDMLEGSTDLIPLMRHLETNRQNACAMADAISALIDDWLYRKMRFERRDEAIRSLMLKMLQAAHLKKLPMPEATLSVRLGVPKVMITDEAAIPDEFCRIKREPDKTKIKGALANLESVPGATLSNAPDSLAVHVR